MTTENLEERNRNGEAIWDICWGSKCLKLLPISIPCSKVAHYIPWNWHSSSEFQIQTMTKYLLRAFACFAIVCSTFDEYLLFSRFFVKKIIIIRQIKNNNKNCGNPALLHQFQPSVPKIMLHVKKGHMFIIHLHFNAQIYSYSN